MKPKDFAQQINLNMDNCWGIVRALVDLCMKQEDGKYLLVKDPNKQLLRLYSVPEDAFQVSGGCDGQTLCKPPMPEQNLAYSQLTAEKAGSSVKLCSSCLLHGSR